MAKKDMNTGILIVGVLVVLYLTGVIGPGAEPAPIVDVDEPLVCDSTTTPAVDFNCRDIENKGTVVTCDLSYIIAGDGNTILTDVGAADVAIDPGKTIEYVLNASGNYAVHGTYKVPCEENPQVSIEFKDYATSPTQQLFAEDDGLLMSASANLEAVAAADEPVLEYKYYAQTRDYVQDALIFCEFDKTYYDDVLLNGEEGSGADIPSHFSFSTTETGMDGTAGAWSVGDIVGTKAIINTLTFDTDDTNDATGFNSTCYIDDQDWFIDEREGSFGYGASDENDADIGQDYTGFSVTFRTE